MSSSFNPEFEYYRRLLLQRRRYYPIYGLLLFIIGWLGSMALIPLYLRNPQALFAFNQYPRLLHFVLILAFLTAIILGLSLIRRAFTRPTIQSIQRFRQQQRQRLFLEAHGRIPWWSSLLVRILIVMVGVFFTAGGMAAIGLFGMLAWDGWIYLIVGGFLLILACYWIPREMKKFPTLSAEQLAQDWITGEETTGNNETPTA
jgi:hypothetical protein